MSTRHRYFNNLLQTRHAFHVKGRYWCYNEEHCVVRTCQVWSVEQNPEDELFIVLDLSLIYAAVTHKKKSVHFK